MAWISSAWERIAVGATHSGLITLEKEEKVATNVNISNFYMYHSPAKEISSMFKASASAHRLAGTKGMLCAQRPHMELSLRELYSQFLSGN